MLMLSALLSTGFTEICTESANLLCIVAAEAHKLSGETTDCCALHIQFDALPHHIYVRLFQAGGGAVVAGGSTSETGFDTVLIIFVHK